MRSETCSRCSQEVRFGTRGTTTGWLHREDVDHIAILGRIATPEDLAEIDRQDREVVRYDNDGMAYTTAEFDILKDKDVDRRRRRLAELKGEDPDYVEPLPPVEVQAHDVDPTDFPPRSGIRQVINLVHGKGKTRVDGWELISVRHARGPYVGADGSVLSISDTHVVKARGPRELDGGLPIAVASWRDGKFDFAFIGTIKDNRLDPHKVDATTMKNWIKGTHDLPAPVQDELR